jgi:polysaccharide biosynthesis/export protein
MKSNLYKYFFVAAICLSLPALVVSRQEPSQDNQQEPATESSVRQRSDYVLGPDDEIIIRALDAEEISNKPIRIDHAGYINVPMLGRLHAAGFTVRELEAEIKTKLGAYIYQADVSVMITNYRSQPVSVIGSVNRPGTIQLEGHKTLVEVLSLAGGLSSDAGSLLKITRRAEWGKIPLPDTIMDPSGEYSIGEVNLRSIMEARKPEENIIIMPNDVLSVPRGQMIYVIGEVKRSGGFVLGERTTISALQAIAMAEGLAQFAKPSDARIIRPIAGSNRLEIPINLKDILAGKTADVPLQAEDIMFVPNSYAKSAFRRTMDATLQAITGIVIYRGW